MRFWDTGFKMISEYNVRRNFPEAKASKDGKDGERINTSIQSIDIFGCKPPPTMRTNGQLTTGYDRVNVGIIYLANPFDWMQEWDCDRDNVEHGSEVLAGHTRRDGKGSRKTK